MSGFRPGWEDFILICARKGSDLPVDKEGFFLSVRHVVEGICSDSAGVNYKARGIITLRHPSTHCFPVSRTMLHLIAHIY